MSDIDYDNKRKIIKLVIINQSTGEVVFSYGASNRKSAPQPKAPQKKPEPPKADAPQAEPPKAVTPPPVNATMEKVNAAPPIDGKEIPAHEKVVNDFLARHKIDKKQFAALRVKALKAGKPVSAKKFTELTPDEYIGMCVIMDGLFEEGFFEEAS